MNAGITTLVRAMARLRTTAAHDGLLLDTLASMVAPVAPAPLVLPPQRLGPGAPTSAAPAPASSPSPTDAPRVPRAQAGEAPVGASARAGLGNTGRAQRLQSEPCSLTLLGEQADWVPPRRAAARSVAPASPAPGDGAAPAAALESLFAPRRVRGILREMTALTTPRGAPDVDALVRMVARARPITRLPRKKVTVLGHTVQWLFDAGPAMLPFAGDKQQLAATALRLLGRDRVRIADFIGHPAQGVRAQRQVRWQPMHWPTPGSTVVLVGDLGLGALEGERMSSAWREFAGECRRRQLRCVAVIPYPHTRWPPAAAAFDGALTWDLATGVQGLRRERRSHERGH
ncbi:MAG: hypothetical protein JNL30_16580 [Rubrivivax sp.]|nr:hypothetical protein [Rubrivivax sp.]